MSYHPIILSHEMESRSCTREHPLTNTRPASAGQKQFHRVFVERILIALHLCVNSKFDQMLCFLA